MKEPKKCIIVDDEPAAHYVLANYIKQNPQLDGASTMLLVAAHFLDRQQQSMQASGMTEQVFCKSAHSP